MGFSLLRENKDQDKLNLFQAKVILVQTILLFVAHSTLRGRN